MDKSTRPIQTRTYPAHLGTAHLARQPIAESTSTGLLNVHNIGGVVIVDDGILAFTNLDELRPTLHTP